jgi:hypothetical protein
VLLLLLPFLLRPAAAVSAAAAAVATAIAFASACVAAKVFLQRLLLPLQAVEKGRHTKALYSTLVSSG